MKSSPANTAPVSADEFRLVCSRFATGVCIVTTITPEHVPHGITVNSFTSLSLDPPLVMVAIGSRSTQLPAFEEAGLFAVNILEEAQETLSRHFARHRQEGRFEGIPWSAGPTGSPLFPDTLGAIECEIVQTFVTGDHRVLVGKVLHAQAHEGKPLLYYRSGYAGLR
ncbi:MAG TPA: flavin reductase family protein [Bryobacteraceae bacterium]|jgi:flavin reductase (DIM6/NTAB) family NADH-FMN oxidoreductase RutF